MNYPVLVLSSGGIDSTAVIKFYLNQSFEVSTLFVDYGQLSLKNEEKAVTKVCEYYNVPLKKIGFFGFKKKTDGFILGRNALLLHIALMEFKQPKGLIGIGIHSSTSYVDCSNEFVNIMQASFDLYTNGCISIGAPFLNWGKKEICEYCVNNQVPLNLTYSCELGLDQPCGRCLSCRDLEVIYKDDS
ncbi:MAG: hypothetical protein APF76_18260 [Desulfitibacter sp. BRH_c19]|nr:MAG: hypothetical protein APF76_18260 [Desulfitibacter sp. BRH_c19]